MKPLKVLIACEESQTICKEFRKLGHEAYSCDIQECSGGHPEWHIKADALEMLKLEWDLIIAHPPCTYMSKAGARWMYPKAGQLSEERLAKAMEAKRFFMAFMNAKAEHIAVENPVPLKVVGLPRPTQAIQPYEFGEPYSKKTLLWLKGLPPLESTTHTHTHPGCRQIRVALPGEGKEATASQRMRRPLPGLFKELQKQLQNNGVNI